MVCLIWVFYPVSALSKHFSIMHRVGLAQYVGKCSKILLFGCADLNFCINTTLEKFQNLWATLMESYIHFYELEVG